MLHAHSFFCLGFPRSDLPPSLFLSSGRCYHPHTDIAPIQIKKITFYKSIPSESSICIFSIWKYQKPKLWHFQRDRCPPTKSTNLPDQRQPMNFHSFIFPVTIITFLSQFSHFCRNCHISVIIVTFLSQFSPYILKAKIFAEPLFQSKKIAEKVRKSGRHFWAIWG